MAYWIAQLEQWFPIAPGDRVATPLFTDDAGQCIHSEWWSRTLQHMLQTFLTPQEAKRYSTHSFRIMLACGAWAAGHSPAAIQALCRWRSLDSLRTYVAWDPTQYDTMVTKALEQNIQASQTLHLPALGPAELLAHLQQFPNNRTTDWSPRGNGDHITTTPRPLLPPNSSCDLSRKWDCSGVAGSPSGSLPPIGLINIDTPATGHGGGGRSGRDSFY